jgi:hypothetical protein
MKCKDCEYFETMGYVALDKYANAPHGLAMPTTRLKLCECTNEKSPLYGIPLLEDKGCCPLLSQKGGQHV